MKKLARKFYFDLAFGAVFLRKVQTKGGFRPRSDAQRAAGVISPAPTPEGVPQNDSSVGASSRLGGVRQ